MPHDVCVLERWSFRCFRAHLEVSFREKMAKYISILQHSLEARCFPMPFLPSFWLLGEVGSQTDWIESKRSRQPSARTVHMTHSLFHSDKTGKAVVHLRSDQQGEAINSVWASIVEKKILIPLFVYRCGCFVFVALALSYKCIQLFLQQPFHRLIYAALCS